MKQLTNYIFEKFKINSNTIKKNYFTDKKQYEKGISVLVPGAGLGRLMYEIAKLGFKSQGNEFSYYMLLSSNFILNNTTKKNEYMIQPLIHSFSNLYNENSPFKEILILLKVCSLLPVVV